MKPTYAILLFALLLLPSAAVGRIYPSTVWAEIKPPDTSVKGSDIVWDMSNIILGAEYTTTFMEHDSVFSVKLEDTMYNFSVISDTVCWNGFRTRTNLHIADRPARLFPINYALNDTIHNDFCMQAQLSSTISHIEAGTVDCCIDAIGTVITPEDTLPDVARLRIDIKSSTAVCIAPHNFADVPADSLINIDETLYLWISTFLHMPLVAMRSIRYEKNGIVVKAEDKALASKVALWLSKGNLNASYREDLRFYHRKESNHDKQTTP